jgi:hypothetical protein
MHYYNLTVSASIAILLVLVFTLIILGLMRITGVWQPGITFTDAQIMSAQFDDDEDDEDDEYDDDEDDDDEDDEEYEDYDEEQDGPLPSPIDLDTITRLATQDNIALLEMRRNLRRAESPRLYSDGWYAGWEADFSQWAVEQAVIQHEFRREMGLAA